MMGCNKIHNIPAERASLHGHFSRDLPPVLTIDPGDTVRFQCLDANWGLEPYNGVDIHRRTFEGRDPVLDDGHALTGPVDIRGAKPSMTLAIRINALQVGAWGTTMAGGWPNPWNERLGITQQGVIHVWTFNHEAQTARNQHGHSVAIRPFMGVMGMPPAEPGIHSTIPPRRTGGNIDCKELVAGSTLYLPVEVEGGLFSVGDGHAAQGDGEISITAIECPVDWVDLTFDLLDDWPLDMPIAHTPAGWVTMGFHTDLDEALVIALEGMLSLLKRLHGLERLDALALASVTVNFHVTQVVNQARGVHAILPHGAIR
jgi:acetamidase/formamidase